MRKLKTRDVVSFSRVITAVNLKDEIADIARDIEEGLSLIHI